MKIGIDISQIVYEGTGVSRFVRSLVAHTVRSDRKNEYVLFGASLRKRHILESYVRQFADLPHVSYTFVPIPPRVLDVMWNVIHIIPVTWFIGSVDVFWSSDWTQPPLGGARGVTTVHDLTVLRHPESFDSTIVTVQTRRLSQAIGECQLFFCDSRATQNDLVELLGVDTAKTKVVYPGFSMGDA